MRPLVYISAPYSQPDPAENTHRAIKVADALLDVCVPVVPHLTLLWHTVSPHDFEVWLAYDLEIVRRCDGLLRLGGASAGADREVEFASQHGVKLFTTVLDVRAWAPVWSAQLAMSS